MNYGIFVMVGSLFPIWIGYLVKFKGKNELIRIRNPKKIRDKEGYVLFMGENFIFLGITAFLIGLFAFLGIREGTLSLLPTMAVVGVMLRMIKGSKNFY